jgi:ferredoxin-NADP reductase
VTSARRTRRNVLLVAGGVGITPMRALFESLPQWAGEDLLLLYTARDDGDVLYLCASPRMASVVRHSLSEAGLPRAQLHEERFDL